MIVGDDEQSKLEMSLQMWQNDKTFISTDVGKQRRLSDWRGGVTSDSIVFGVAIINFTSKNLERGNEN